MAWVNVSTDSQREYDKEEGRQKEEEKKDDEEELSEWYSHRYKSLVARANYLAHDRSDIQDACKELSGAMASPCFKDWEALKRLARYLKGAPRVVQFMPWQRNVDTLVVFSDANWAGDKKTRKSTSGGAIHLGGVPIWWMSKTQATVALSSAEAEYVAGSECAKALIGFHNQLTELIRTVAPLMESKIPRPRMFIDNEAAKGILAKTATPQRVKHIDARYLYVRELIEQNRMDVYPVRSKKQVADIHAELARRGKSMPRTERPGAGAAASSSDNGAGKRGRGAAQGRKNKKQRTEELYSNTVEQQVNNL